jgi:hypothetical protein
MIATGVLSPRSLVVAVGETVWRSVEETFPETRPPSGPPALPPTLPASAPVSAPPARAASTPTVGKTGASWFGKLGFVGKLAVVFGAGLLLLIVLAGAAGGPDRQQLETELARVEAEGFQLSREAQALRSFISDAQYSQILGTSAAIWGVAQDDGGLAWDGVATAGNAAMDEHQAIEALKPILARLEQLAARRQQLVEQLR